MLKRGNSPQAERRRRIRAQAVMELAVFGSIFIFILGSILQQGYSAAMYQQGQLQALRTALFRSYQSTQTGTGPSNYKYNSASFLVFEDRLSVGAAKQGVVDRQPLISQGSGTLTKGLYYTVDWSDLTNAYNNSIPVQDLQVNGQEFKLTQSAAVWLRIRRSLDSGEVKMSYFSAGGASGDVCSDGVPFNNPAAIARFKREWDVKCPHPGNCSPNVWATAAAGNDTFTKTDSFGTDAWRYDYNRNGDLSDDLWMNVCAANSGGDTCRRGAPVAWKWTQEDLLGSKVSGAIKPDDGTYPSFDVDGDMIEETIYQISDHGAVNCSGSQRVIDIAVLDSGAGDVDPSDPLTYDDPNEISGMKPDAAIYTKLNDGTVLEIRHGAYYNPTTGEAVMTSMAKKSQDDVISRIYQLNRRVAMPRDFADRHAGVVEVSCGDPDTLTAVGHGGCCMTPDNVLKTCYDMGARTLFIRSRILDERGRMWLNKVDSSAENGIFK